MEENATFQDYIKKLQRAIDCADLTFLRYKFVKKNRIDDLMVCTISVMPQVFKNALTNKLEEDKYPSVFCYNRFKKIVKHTFFLAPEYYIFDFNEAMTMLANIIKSFEDDVRRLTKK